MENLDLETIDYLIRHVKTTIQVAKQNAEALARIEERLKALELPPQKKYIGIEEAAEITKYTVGTLYRKVGEKEIPFYKTGRKIMFEYTELLKWVEEHRQATSAERYESYQAKITSKK